MISKSLQIKLRRMLCNELSDDEYLHAKQQIQDGVGELGQFYRDLNENVSGLGAETILLGSIVRSGTSMEDENTSGLARFIENPSELAEKIRRSDPSSTLDHGVLAAIASGERPIDYVTAVTLAEHLDQSVAALMGGRPGTQSYLRQTSAGNSARAVATSGGKADWSDAQLELEDFVGSAVAKETIAAWKEGKAALESFLDAYGQTVDRYTELKVRLLTAISLTKNHGDADRYDDELVAAASRNDKAEQLDALYLRGRSRWYLNQISSAIPDMRAAYQLAIELRNPVRQAQAALYLSRLAVKHIRDFGESESVQWAEEAEELAMRGGRPDIQLLAMRARVIALRNQGQRDEAVRFARTVINQRTRWLDAGLDRIFRAFQIYHGVCLLNGDTKESLDEAEEIFSAIANGGSSQQEAGMASYLWADVHTARLQQAWQKAARSNDSDRQHWIEVAKKHRIAAIELCERGRQILRSVGDIAAERKAAQRLLTLRGQTIDLPKDEIDILEDFAARNHSATAFLLGGLEVQNDGSVGRAGKFSTEAMEGFLNTYFQGLVALGAEQRADAVSLANFITPETLLAVPWKVGNDLIVRVFTMRKDGAQLDSVGLFSIDDACGLAVRRAIRELTRSPNELMDIGGDSLFSRLQDSLVTADALTLKERSDFTDVEQVIVLPPRHPEDWALPVEWLETDSDVDSCGISLLEFSRNSVVFSGFGGDPLSSLTTSMDGQTARLLATEQAYADETILSYCRRVFGGRVEELGAATSGDLDDRPVFVFAHDDSEQSVDKIIQGWNWSQTKIAVLLFCSSGQHRSVRGPFVDGISFRVQRSMPRGGLVVGARLPVTLPEAISFSQAVMDEPDSSVPVVQRVTRYLKFVKRRGGSPFRSPWVVIG